MKGFSQSVILFFLLVVSAYAAEPQSGDGKDNAEIYLANANPETVTASVEKATYSPEPAAEINLPLEWKNILSDLADKTVGAGNSADYYR